MKDRIKQIRTELGISQQEFGKRLEVGNSAVSVWERGRKVPARVVSRICEKFNVNRAWLESGDGPMFGDPKPIAPENLDDARIATAMMILKELDDASLEAGVDVLRKIAAGKYAEKEPPEKKKWEYRPASGSPSHWKQPKDAPKDKAKGKEKQTANGAVQINNGNINGDMILNS